MSSPGVTLNPVGALSGAAHFSTGPASGSHSAAVFVEGRDGYTLNTHVSAQNRGATSAPLYQR